MYINVMKRLAVLAVSVLTLGACTTYPVAVNNETIAPRDYIIGPGDDLRITVWRNPELSTLYATPVRPDGKITVQLAENVQASGKTASELSREIEKVMSKFIRDPLVTVVITNFVSPFKEQVRVVGPGAAKPAALAYREDMSLLDVVIAVGGLTDFAAGNRASVIRTVDGKAEKLHVRLNDLIRRGDITANIAMHPGDVLVVPESFF